ncbi:uncharacterized protein EV154DRAFT_203598 [Mucor mucedo]|uniref:uncharacterized protein n=1 Tax=Mucor mucedo TaxID=29922 RepID=UPI00221E4BBB|nr:uncharacterized protein EV154DRAFT_203598 [Mucor mucedo]KAI7892087.1 hypothetical protein EV154DRAFT_203598 [Mucor mucedo]
MVYICSICTDSLDSPDQYPVTLPCRHIFHNDCVGAWIEQQKKCPFCKMHTKTEDIKTLYFSSEEDGPRNDSDWKNAAAKYRVYFKKAAEDLKISRAANIYLERRIDAYKKIARDLVKEEELQWRLSDNKKRLELELETAQKKIIQQEELIKQLDRDLVNSAKNLSYQVETAKEKENELKRKDSEMWDKYLFKEAELSSCKSDLARQTENLRKQLSFFTDHHVQCINSAIPH